jgi:hypothetical protein
VSCVQMVGAEGSEGLGMGWWKTVVGRRFAKFDVDSCMRCPGALKSCKNIQVPAFVGGTSAFEADLISESGRTDDLPGIADILGANAVFRTLFHDVHVVAKNFNIGSHVDVVHPCFGSRIKQDGKFRTSVGLIHISCLLFSVNGLTIRPALSRHYSRERLVLVLPVFFRQQCLPHFHSHEGPSHIQLSRICGKTQMLCGVALV